CNNNRFRKRACDHPAPQNNGTDCVGEKLQNETCVRGNNDNCPVNGNWSAWVVSSECSATCGDAYRTLSRTCTDPAPKNGGEDCSGSSEEKQKCPYRFLVSISSCVAKCIFLSQLTAAGRTGQNGRSVQSRVKDRVLSQETEHVTTQLPCSEGPSVRVMGMQRGIVHQLTNAQLMAVTQSGTNGDTVLCLVMTALVEGIRYYPHLGEWHSGVIQ
ncbi:MLP-like protein, partial [Mya arenaria]